MILEPGEYFGISRQLADPNESATLYVRAVVRNARTDASIDTVNLTDKGSGRFQAEWQVTSAVASGGLYISITTYVYTDSGYTTLSDVYAAESNTYLVEPRNMGGGGGGGGGISRKMLKEVLQEVIGGEKKEDKDWTPVLEHIKTEVAARSSLTAEDVEAIVMRHAPSNEPVLAAIGKLENTDLSPVLQAIADIPETDLTGVIEAVNKRNTELEEAAEKMKKILESVEENIQSLKELGEGVTAMKEVAAGKIIEGMKAAFEVVEKLGLPVKKEEKKEEGPVKSPFQIIKEFRKK